MTGKGSSVTGLDVARGRDGKAFIAVDSLVDMFTAMADKMAGGPAEKSFRLLIDTFTPMSSYAAMRQETASADDGSRPLARRCACGVGVIDAAHFDGSTVVVDADNVPDGEFFVFGVKQGRTKVATWEQKLDGINTVRLRAHSCDSQRPSVDKEEDSDE